MKEILHQRMFETGSYKSLPKHIALYEALEASMEHQSKRRRHDAGASGSSQPQAPQSSAWKKSDTRDSPSSSSKPAWVIPTSHIPDAVNNCANALATTYQALTENPLLEKIGDMRTFMNWYCQKIGKTELTQADLEGQAYEVVKPFYLDVVHLQFQMEECHKMLTDQIEWASRSKGSGQALSISKMKAARYHDFGLELLIPEHMWIDDVCTYDISASYGHLNHLPSSDIRMLSTAVKPWTRNLVIRQRVEDFQLGIESYQKQLNLTKPRWDATHFEFKHDYTIIDSPCVVVFPITLDYRVKKYKVNRLNSGMDTWFWTDKDVERSKEFIHAIERSLKTRSIFRNLECFVGGRVRDIDYRLLLRTE
ncbi:hypothetical protein Tco_1134592 [Tanacetum coccineum]